MILGPTAFQLRSKIDKKASQDRSKFKHKFGQHLDPFFDGFWDQLGSILGAFCRPNWSHVGTKWHQNRISKPMKKIITFWKASGTNFNQFLVDFGSNLGGPGGSNESVFWWLCWLLEPRCAQDPSKSPTRGPKSPQEPNFGRILEDFWLIFG